MVSNGKQVFLNYFKCETTEGSSSFPKMEVVAELVLDSGKLARVHHINTDEIKHALEKAVLGAVWFNDVKVEPEKEGV